jgi:hypothetical protein
MNNHNHNHNNNEKTKLANLRPPTPAQNDLRSRGDGALCVVASPLLASTEAFSFLAEGVPSVESS